MPGIPLKAQPFSCQKAFATARLVEMAKALSMRDMEALLQQLDAETVTPLEGNWEQLFARLPSLGPLTTLTRNEGVLHECRGPFGPTIWNGSLGIMRAANLDLRLFTRHWKYLFAVQVPHAQGVLSGLHIFDASGKAVQKIYLEPEAEQAAYRRLINDLRQKHDISQKPPVISEPDSIRLQKQHRPIHDTSLKVIELESGAVPRLLELVRATQENVLIRMDNAGIQQTYRGRIQNLERAGDWFQVLDPAFKLHIAEQGLHRTFIVHRPTCKGWISSLEIISGQDEPLLSLTSSGGNESIPSELWTELLTSLSPD